MESRIMSTHLSSLNIHCKNKVSSLLIYSALCTEVRFASFLSGGLTTIISRVSVQGVKSLGGHFACLCRGFDFYEVKKIVIIFQNEKGNTFTLLIIFIVKSLQKEQNSTNLLL